MSGVAKSSWTLDQLVERARASVTENGGGEDRDAFARLVSQLRDVDGDYRFGRDLASAQELNHVLYDPLLADSGPMFEYEPGSWGPPQADRLVAGVGGWNTPQ